MRESAIARLYRPHRPLRRSQDGNNARLFWCGPIWRCKTPLRL